MPWNGYASLGMNYWKELEDHQDRVMKKVIKRAIVTMVLIFAFCLLLYSIPW